MNKAKLFNGLLIYYLCAILYGITSTCQKVLNSGLSQAFGNWFSVVIVHFVGLVCLLPSFINGSAKATGKAKWYEYIGGVIGVFVVAFTNIGVNNIGVTANMVFLYVGQILTATLVDDFGLQQGQKYKLSLGKIIAIIVMIAGVFVLAGQLGLKQANNLIGCVFSLLTGACLIATRSFNRTIAIKCGKMHSTLMNYVTGLAASLLIFICTGCKITSPTYGSVNWLYYFGGVFGCIGIILSNTASPKLSSLSLSALIFFGSQVSSIVVDLLNDNLNIMMLIGTIIVSIGVIINMIAENNTNQKVSQGQH